MRFRQRIVSAICALVIVVGVLPTASAERVTTAGNAWQSTDDISLAGIRMTRSDAYNWVVGELTRISAECTTAMDSTANPNAAKILSLYGSYLAYLNWVVSNVSYASFSEQWTVFQSPEAYDAATVADLIDGAELLRNRINQLGILPSMTNVSNGTFNATAATSTALPSSEELLQGDMIYGYLGYREGMQKLLQEYVEGQVLVILARHFNVNGSSRTELRQALSTHFTDEWCTSTLNGSPPAEMIQVITSLKDELLPYMDVMNQICAANDVAVFRMLASETYEAGGRTYELTGYKYKSTTETGLESSVGRIVQAIYSYMYSSQTSDLVDDSILLDAVDESKGALPIMSNAEIRNGEVVPDTGLELTTLGYYILAAGGVYDPFVSIAGNDTYISVIESFLAQNDQKEKVIRVLQNAINTKKPIYVADASKNTVMNENQVTEVPVAKYRIAYLTDMVDATQDVAKIYTVINGAMRASQVDSSTWEYVQGGSGSTTNNSTQTVNVGENGENDTVNITLDEQNMGAMTTVGQEEVLLSADQIAMPVAYTCGSSSLVYAGNSAPGAVQTIGGLTTVIMHNAAQDAQNNEYLQNASTEMLFLNGLGDIVLSDGTIVLPAIANPILYTYDENNGSVVGSDYLVDVAVDSEESFMEALSETHQLSVEAMGYYPYTATFSNHYPASRIGEDMKVYLYSSADVGKYVITVNPGLESHIIEARQIYASNRESQLSIKVTDRINVAPVNGQSLATWDDTTMVEEAYQYWSGSTGNFRTYLQGILSAGYYTETFNPFYLVYRSRILANGEPLFPLNEDSADIRESYLNVAGPLVTSAVRYISTAQTSTETTLSSSGTFRIESYIKDFLGQGMLGNSYSETMVKNYQLSYEQLVDDQYGRFTRLIKDFVSDAVDNLGRIDGVLAIKNGYENSFFNAIVDIVQRGYILICIVLFVIIAVKFLRGRCSTVYVVFIGLVAFAAFEVYAVWMPTAVPAAYNFFVNDVVEDVVWNTVTIKSESYEEVYKDAGRIDAQTGELRPYTATVTLYRLSSAELEQIAERANVPSEDIRSGNPVFLDESAGIFVQGDAIKLSIDRLWANNAMRGLYRSQWELVDEGAEEDVELLDVQESNNPYILKLTSPYVSLESYYTPFCHIERAFMVNLNNFANIFRVDRRVYNYGGSLYKDAFLFNSFTNSGIFTSPDDETYTALMYNIQDDSILGSVTATKEDIIALCEKHLQPFDDWLNLRGIFSNPSQSMRDSLWGQMLQRQGYYSDDWTMTPEQEEKVWDLINYINEQTKLFVIRNQDQMNFCSDENAIKLVSLYATTCFTHRVSEFGYWLYPNYINAGDIELADVLYGSMTTLKDRNSASDGDIVNTVTLNLGVWGAILILLITVLSAVFVFIMTYLVPVLYALLGIIFVYKLLNDESNLGLVKGYVKVTITTVILYMAYSFGLKLVAGLGYKWYGYLGTLLVTALCVYFLFFVCLSVVTNPLELGNDTLMRNMFGALDRLMGHHLSKLTANNLQIRGRNVMSSVGYSGVRAYTRTASVDEHVSTRHPRRGEHYGRWSDFDDDNMSVRARVINRFGMLEHADEVGRTRTGFRTTRVVSGVRNVADRVTSFRNRGNNSGSSET